MEEQPKKIQCKRTVWDFFVCNRRFTVVLTLTFIILGVISIFQIPKESQPEVDFPIGVITTIYPGASAEDVEELVTNVIEDKVVSISDVENVTSISRQGFSSIVVEFDVDADSSEKITDLKDEVDKAKADLPDDAQDPEVQKISFENEPILRLAISGPLSIPQLKSIADDLKDRIERVPGVSEVNIIGGQEREIKVIVDKAKLDGYGIALGQVTSAIKQSNTDIPIGRIESAGEKYTLNFSGRIKSAEEVSQIPVTSRGESLVYVRDLAEVVDGFKEMNSISRLSVDGSDPTQSVSVSILKVGGGNILQIASQVKSILDEFEKESLPENVKIEVVDDSAKLIRDDLQSLSINGLQTIAIVLVLLLLAVGLVPALLASLAIPLSFLITFIFLSYIGYSLNFITLFSLILALGIIVDSSIVVVDGINKYLKQGVNSVEAAIMTINEFKAPLAAGTLTTVFAFLPMILTSGIIGKFIRSIPVTVTIVLLSSFFVAMAVITAFGSRWLRGYRNGTRTFLNGNKIFDRLTASYERILNSLFKSKALRKIFFSGIIIAFIFSLLLPASGVLEVNLFPVADFDFFFIDIKEPFGTPLETTSMTARKVESVLLNDENIKSFQTNIGSGSGIRSTGAGLNSGEHLGYIFINLKEDRDKKSDIMVEEYQKLFAQTDFGVAEVYVTGISAGPPSGSPVEMRISGESLQELDRLSREFEDMVAGIPGTRNVGSSVETTNGEFLLNIDRAKAKLYGLDASQVALTLRNAVSGLDATVIREGGEDTNVLVKYSLGENSENTARTTLNRVESLTITTVNGPIPLSSFTSSELKNSRSYIYHEDGVRTIRVSSDIAKGVTAQSVVAQIKEKIGNVEIPENYSVTFGGEQEDIEQSFTDMIKAMILGIFLIAALLVMEFNSYRQPLFILITIPLSFIGIFPGLVLMGQPLSFPGVIGIVALAGIVVNNAIILMDRVNNNRRQGMDCDAALLEAGKTRLQPIILTTITTVGGVLPLALSNPTWAPIAYSIIFGLLFSTVLTLVAIPLIYRAYGERELDTMF